MEQAEARSDATSRPEAKAADGRPPVLAAIKFALTGLHAVSPKLAGRVAYELFFHVNRRAPKPAEREVLSSAKRSTLVQDGHDVPVYVWGDQRETVLLVHGWEGYAGQFAPMVSALRGAGFRVVSFDAPGHGAARGRSTNTSQMTAIAQSLSAEFGPFRVVVGHSFGAMVVSCLLKQMPEAAQQAVLIAGVFGSDTLLEGFQSITGVSDAVVTALVASVERIHQGNYYDYSGEKLVPGQRVPALIIHDRADRDVPPREADRYLAAWPSAQRIWTDGLGHRRILADAGVIERVVELARAARART